MTIFSRQSCGRSVTFRVWVWSEEATIRLPPSRRSGSLSCCPSLLSSCPLPSPTVPPREREQARERGRERDDASKSPASSSSTRPRRFRPRRSPAHASCSSATPKRSSNSSKHPDEDRVSPVPTIARYFRKSGASPAPNLHSYPLVFPTPDPARFIRCTLSCRTRCTAGSGRNAARMRPKISETRRTVLDALKTPNTSKKMP